MTIRRPDFVGAAALTPPYVPYETEADRSAFTLAQLVAVLRARWYVIAVSLALCLGLGVLVVLMTPKGYTATVSILLDGSPRVPPGSDALSVPQGTPDSTLIDTQVRLFASDTVLRRVAQQENLGEDPEFVSLAPGLRARLFGLFGLAPSPGPDAARDRLSQATVSLLRAVTVKRSDKTYVVDVDVATRDADKSARLANAIAGAYLADQRAARLQVSRRDTAWLNQRIGELQGRLREAENRAQDFRARNNLVDANGKNLIEQDLADASGEVAKARARVVEAKAKADLFRAALASGRVQEIGDVGRYQVLDRLRSQAADLQRQEANLRTTLADRHPALREVQNQISANRQQITAELRRVADLAQSDLQMAQRAAAETEKRLGQARETTQRNSQLMVELRDLERDVEASRDVYQRFLRSREVMADEGGGDGVTARVIAPAQAPAAASSPKTFAILFVAAAAGLFFGAGGAVAADYAAQPRRPAPRRRRDEATGEIYPQVPAIAVLPRLSSWPQTWARFLDFMLRNKLDQGRARASLLTEVDRRPQGAFAAAMGLVLTSALGRPRRRAQRSAYVVLVVGLESGAGTSVTASNLAFAAAAAGKSVLLIDANPDAPALAALVTDTSQAALINLHGAYRPIFHVQGQTAELDLVPILPEENELCFRLAQERAREPIDGIQGRYDVVVMDGPALGFDQRDRDLVAAADRVLLVAADGTQEDLHPDDLIYDLDMPTSKFGGIVLTFPRERAA